MPEGQGGGLRDRGKVSGECAVFFGEVFERGFQRVVSEEKAERIKRSDLHFECELGIKAISGYRVEAGSHVIVEKVPETVDDYVRVGLEVEVLDS